MPRAMRSVGRPEQLADERDQDGVTAAAIQVPAIHRREVTSAAVADAALAITSVRMLRRCSSSRLVRGGEPIAEHHNEASFSGRLSRYLSHMAKLQDKKVAFLATDGVEQVELTEPWKAVEKEGGSPS